MQVDVITRPEVLQSLKDNWIDVYARDDEAQYFLSWAFMSTFLRRFDGSWFVLAARRGPAGSAYSAFLPLRLRTRMSRQSGVFHNEIIMGGNHTADYTGTICAPGLTDQALAAFGKHLRRMNWTRLHLENLRMSDRRRLCFLSHLDDSRLTFRQVQRVNKTDNVDNLICPAVDLPESFDLFLQQKVGSSTRQRMRRYLRKAEGTDGFRIGVADAATLERDVEVLLALWRARGSARKGKLVDSIERGNRLLLRQAFATGSLFLPVLWQHETPLCALASFLDPVRKTMLFHMAGRDETVDVLPSGLVLHAYSIRHAIALGFRRYDMMRGNEPYKYSFGAQDTRIHCIVVQTRTGRNLGERPDPLCLGGVLLEATRLHREMQPGRAEKAYRQILDSDPRHGAALNGLGQLLAGKGDHRAAADVFRILVDVAPRSPKAWFRLGTALQALNQAADALQALLRAVDLNAEFAAAQYALGRCQAELGLTGDASRTFASMLRNGFDDPTDRMLRARARAQLHRLKRRENPLYVMPKVEPAGPALSLAPAAPGLGSSAAALLLAPEAT